MAKISVDKNMGERGWRSGKMIPGDKDQNFKQFFGVSGYKIGDKVDDGTDEDKGNG